MWKWAVWVVAYALAAARQDKTQSLDDYDADSFPYEEPSRAMKKITGRSIFITPTVVRCPDRYHYNHFYDKCVKRIWLIRTEEQLLHQLNTMYGSPQKDQNSAGSLSGRRINTNDRLTAIYRNLTLTYPGVRIRHSGHRRGNKHNEGAGRDRKVNDCEGLK